MPERASIFEVVQFGVETTPGTSVSANKRLQALTVQPRIQADTANVRPTGSKFPTSVVLGKEWVEARLGGQPAFNDMTYILASCISYAAPTGSGSAKTWTFTPSNTGFDTVKTYTVEMGSSVRAGKFTYGLVTGFGLSYTRDRLELSGTMLGRAYQDGITMTSNPTYVTLVPMLPTNVSVYMDDTSAGIGTTKLTRCFEANFEISDRFGPLWVLDAAQPSFVAHVEKEPNARMRLKLEADADGMSLLSTLRNNSRKFLRIEVTGPEIETGASYRMRLDMCGMVRTVNEWSDEDGVYAIEFELASVYDSTWGKALTVELVNTVSAL